ncbi:hypothetical protein FRC98_07050 [Lujinxingia vulgaris]|uniref:Phospholipase D-like domain-containing protein n=1 Tax=Lujinxingia vulgaris TaxID=2600176 RepID=A0A5C6XEY1_9DELT|nr:hypothetical protein [Lujinxingia vulgaris]TXD37447.1 hypothetical protein FRC98_07050 [Lujinxingia vulgaris]
MGEVLTIRERVERAAAFFHRQEGVVLTTFNLNAPFLEAQVLPTVLGVEAKTEAARRAQTHQRLAMTPCTVFYDPGVSPRLSGHYRVVARPVPLQRRFFHPKLIVMAGRCEEGVTWVYLAVSSANLSMSGWGRNAECFGETWIHTKHQQTWGALDALLEWLQEYAPLDEGAGGDAVARVLEALRRMPARKRFQNDPSQPWAGTLRARFYTSVMHPAGFADFMQLGRSRAPKELRVYSPYWSEVAEGLASFGAKRNVVVPARRVDGVSLGLSREQAAELSEDVAILKNTEDRGTRFWHMKLYRIVHGKHVYTAVGSCNFTRAGFAGASGNVEAALVYRSNPGWFPEGEPADDADFADEAAPEEGGLSRRRW